jgi:hypothetical protein
MPTFPEHFVGPTKVDDKGVRVADGYGCVVTPAKEGDLGPTILCGLFVDGKPEGEIKKVVFGITYTMEYDDGVIVEKPRPVLTFLRQKIFMPVEDGYYFGQTKDDIGAPLGIPHGKGETYHKDGSYHCGVYEEGKENGRGELIYPNGDRFYGFFRNGKPQFGMREIRRLGTCIRTDEYDQDCPSGPLTLTFDKPPSIYFSYEGQVKDFTPHGEGTASYCDEGRYISYQGTFQNGKRHGEGCAIDKDGKECVGVWVEDTLTNASKRPRQ